MSARATRGGTRPPPLASPAARITRLVVRKLTRHLRAGSSELVLGSLKRHSRERVIVAVLGGTANVSTTRAVAIVVR